MKNQYLTDDHDFKCKELRVLPLDRCIEGANILCSYQGYCKEISFRKKRNQELEKFTQFDIPKWEDLKIYDKIEE